MGVSILHNMQTYTREELNNMSSEYNIMVENLRINDIAEKIRLKVLQTARTSSIKSYQWFPENNGAMYGLPPVVPSKRILLEVCNKLRVIFVDCDIRILDASIFINWY